jgi:hypothetical protein
MSAPATSNNWSSPCLILSVEVAPTGYLAFSLWTGWRAVLAVHHQLVGPQRAILLGSTPTHHWLRSLAWQRHLIRFGHRLHWKEGAIFCVASFALRSIPGKRSKLLYRAFPKFRSVPYISSTAAFISERLAGAGSCLASGLGTTYTDMTLMLLWRYVSEADAVSASLIIQITPPWLAVALEAQILMTDGKGFNWPPKPLPQTP